MDIDEFEDYLELQDPQVRNAIQKSQAEYLAGKSRPTHDLLAAVETGTTSTRSKAPRRQRS
jgi:hypothetical protein